MLDGMVRPHAVALVVVAVVGAFATTLRAQAMPERPIAAALTVSDPGGCLDHDALVRHVTRLLRRETIDASIGIVVTAATEGTGAVRIAMQRGDGNYAERRLDHMPQDCQARLGALALVIAIAIDPTVIESVRVETIRAPSIVVPAERATYERASLAAIQPVPAPRPAANRPGPTVRSRVAALMMFEVLPGLAWGATAGLGVGLLSWLELRFDLFGAASASLSVGRGGADVTLIGGGVSACVLRRLTGSVGFVLRGCGGLAAGSLVARGRGFDLPSTAYLAWPAARANVEGELTIGPHFGLSLGVDAWVPLIETRIAVQDGSGATLDAVSLAPVGVGVTLGPAITF